MLNLIYKDFISKYEPEVQAILKKNDLVYPDISYVRQGQLLNQILDLMFDTKYPNEDKFIK